MRLGLILSYRCHTICLRHQNGQFLLLGSSHAEGNLSLSRVSREFIWLIKIFRTSCSPGGVGHALALEFASQNLRVFATARSTSSLSSLAEKGIETFALDVTNLESITALKNEISKRTGGKLDILFNNAGTSISPSQPFFFGCHHIQHITPSYLFNTLASLINFPFS